MEKNKKKIKVRQFWSRDPTTQVHKDQKNEYNRSQSKRELEQEIEDAMTPEENDDFDDLF